MLIRIQVLIHNFLMRMRGGQASFGFVAKENVFFVEDSGERYFFGNWKRGKKLYRLGLRARAERLFSEYHLSLVGLVNGDTVIDCGANYGDLFLSLKLKNLDVDYYGFEPGPQEFRVLVKNARGGQCVNKALGAESGSVDFYLSSRSADSSLIQPSQYTEKMLVKAARLDDFLLGPAKLLKLEAEGAELEVLLGAEMTLKRIHFISADLGPERGVAKELTFIPVYNFLISKGFKLVQLGYPRLIGLFENTELRQ